MKRAKSRTLPSGLPGSLPVSLFVEEETANLTPQESRVQEPEDSIPIQTPETVTVSESPQSNSTAISEQKEKPCIEWNKAHRRLRNEPLTLTFDVEHPGELQAGIRAYSDRVTVIVDSGDPGGQRATNLREETSWEFAEEMQRFLLAWFDGAAVGLRPANLPKNAYPVARKGQIEYVTVPED
jgi:hypothetical protein